MSHTETIEKVQDLINGLMIVLSEKEKFIIENRFSLNDKPKLTLENIGQHYSVTRERIRQIEKNALKKLERNVNNTPLYVVTQLALEALSESGGLCEEDLMIKKILRKVNVDDCINTNSLKLTVDLEKDISHIHNTIQLRPYYKASNVKKTEVKAICDAGYKLLSKKSSVVNATELAQEVNTLLGRELDKNMIASCFHLDRRLKVVDGESVGLASWRDINPKTLRDKIFYVLRAQKKPLHYLEIAEKISGSRFDKKNVNTQAVHNELIRYDEFVLIGRGIYALSEWGYSQGTVADVITNVLKENGALTREEIVEKVLEKRKVKKITILLNLKNKSQFVRVGRDKYTLEEK
jgi:hypothetical protein